MENQEPIRLNIQYGEENRSDSLKAYKAENELKKAVRKNIETIECHLHNKFKLPNKFIIKNLLADGSEEYSLIDAINSKLTNTKISVCLSTYDLYLEKGIEAAIEKLHLQSNLIII